MTPEDRAHRILRTKKVLEDLWLALMFLTVLGCLYFAVAVVPCQGVKFAVAHPDQCGSVSATDGLLEHQEGRD